ncbi:DUF3016 domain-containing protein [Duganella aceris]|uniref:DUF3016 domain-containing protein n=1 Tax=Duganella aceris TaxID=2703883 RepID=A0ABX0FD88_9BURK|nr:DUF3016 domain-containing protein [Duganella aceris]NGZ82837.1 DUF3016 domain-containing protein [Duganella aceris]
MRLITRTMLAAAVALLASSAAWAEVSVTYVKPDDYTDVSRSQIERERTLKDFSEYFAKLDKKLPAGQTLKIEVLDIDLAGRFYPRRNGEDIRIMNGGADWPHMHLRYTLEQDGKTLRSGDDELSNMSYQERLSGHYSSDPLRYEKQMLDDWFEKKIVPKVAAR